MFDETYLWTIAFRDMSWCKADDKTKDMQDDDVSDHRACVLHALFSHKDEQPMQDGKPAAFKAWMSHWVGKKHGVFKGPCTGDVILAYVEQ